MKKWIAFFTLFIPALLNAQPAAFTGCPDGTENPAVQNAANADKLFSNINAARAASGKPALIRNSDLDKAARYHAQDMADDDYLSHDTFDRDSTDSFKVSGCNMWVRVKRFYADEGAFPEETIGAGWSNADSVVFASGGLGWMSSPSHTSIVTSNNFNEVGVGFYSKSGTAWTNYWVANYGFRSGVGTAELNGREYQLDPVFPNPFETNAAFNLRVAKTQLVKIDIVNLLGQTTGVIHEGTLRAGNGYLFTITRDMLDDGKVFFYRITGENFSAVRKVTLY